MTIQGAGPGVSIITGPSGGSTSTVTLAASGATIEGFTITRDGNAPGTWNSPLNTAGLSIQGQSFTGITISDNLITGNRTGIDINNSNGHTITRNLINDNRTGLLLRNQTDNLTVTQNEIRNNWTVGVLFLDGSGGTNVPVQTATSSVFSQNNVSGNWYGQVADRQSGGSLPAAGSNVKDFSGNYLGTTAPTVTTANTTEPGYAAQIPVEFGGTATQPLGQPDIAGPASANIDYTPLLGSGVDNAPGTYGFQSAYTALTVTDNGAQTGGGRVSEALALLASAGTVSVEPGTYSETATLAGGFTSDGVTLEGTDANDRPVITGGIAINNAGDLVDGLTLRDLSVKGAVASPTNKNAVISMFEGGGGVKDLTVDHVLIDGESTIYNLDGSTPSGFGGRNGIYLRNATGTVTVINSVLQNLKGRCAFDTNCNGSGGFTYPSAIVWDSNTVKDSDAAVAFRGQSSASRLPAVTLKNSAFQNVGPSSNSFGGAVKAFNVSSLTAVGNTFDTVGTSGFDPTTLNISSEGGRIFGAGLTVKNLTTMAVSGNTFTAAREGFAVDPGGTAVPGGSMTQNTFSGNDVAIYLPSTVTDFTASPTIARNRIVGSTSVQVHNGGTGNLKVENNWWGCNSGCDTANGTGTTDSDPRLVLDASAVPATVAKDTGISAVNANILRNSAGETVDDLDDANDSPVPASPVSFTEVGGPLGAFTATSASTDKGQASTTWAAGSSTGTAQLRVTVDSQSITNDVAVVDPNATPPGDGDVQVVNGGTGGSATTGNTADSTDPVASTVAVPPGGNGGVVSIEEIPSNGLTPAQQAQQPAGTFSVLGTQVVIHAPDQTRANPLVLTFVVNKAASASTPDQSVEVFRNGAALNDCTPYDAVNSAIVAPDVGCVKSRARAGNELTITVLTAQASLWAVGAPALETDFDSGPGVNATPIWTNSTTPTWTFHATDTNTNTVVSSQFECADDLGTVFASPCATSAAPNPASYAYPAFANDGSQDGPHTFTAQANDGFAAGPQEDVTWFLDTQSPTVSIGTKPALKTNSSTANFTRTRNDPGGTNASGFPPGNTTECSLVAAGNPASYGPCDNTLSDNNTVAEGNWTLSVRVTDRAGNQGTDSYTWEYDFRPPNTTLTNVANTLPGQRPGDTGGPKLATAVQAATFTFDSTPADPPYTAGTGNRFRCVLDSNSAACNGGTISYGAGVLGNGLHTFSVYAIDDAGNEDPTPATWTWFVDKLAPGVTGTYPADGGRYSFFKDTPSSFFCTDPQIGPPYPAASDVASCVGPAGIVSGQPFDHTSLGTPTDASPITYPFAVTRTDQVGNSSNDPLSYRIFTFKGLILDDNPIAYYRMDDGAGSSVMKDVSGFGRDGEYKNGTDSGPEGISGDSNTARVFTGRDGYGFVNGIDAPRNRYTLTAFVKFDDASDGMIVQHGGGGALFRSGSSSVFRQVDTNVSLSVPGGIIPGCWYFVAGRFDGSRATIYAGTHDDGALDCTPGGQYGEQFFTPVSINSARKWPSGTATFYAGYGDQAPWLKGSLDEIAYFDKALSPTHIEEIWLADPPPSRRTIAHSADSSQAASSAGAGAAAGDSAKGAAKPTSAAKAKAKAKARVKSLSRKLAMARTKVRVLQKRRASRRSIAAAQRNVAKLSRQLRAGRRAL